MASIAHVRSIDAVERFRAGLLQFGEGSAQALDEIRMESDRFVEWLEFEQTSYWQNEVRRCEAKVAEAKVDLHRARSATIDPEHTPTCLQEQKVLDLAKRRLVATEEKLHVVRRWIPRIRQAVRDYQTQISPLVNYLAYELPSGANLLGQLVARLEDYLAVAPPAVTNASAAMSLCAASAVDVAKNGNRAAHDSEGQTP